jgi:hypothetical protein
MQVTIGRKTYQNWRDVPDDQADDLREERDYQQHMDKQGARQIGVALYEE